jgi:hypothetical protein
MTGSTKDLGTLARGVRLCGGAANPRLEAQ